MRGVHQRHEGQNSTAVWRRVLLSGCSCHVRSVRCRQIFSGKVVLYFEVLSPDTERTDRREKAIAYRQIPGIKTYVLLEQDHIVATVLRAAEVGWDSEGIEGKRGLLKLPEIGAEIPLERIYERTVALKKAD